MSADFHPLKRYVESTAKVRQVTDTAKFLSKKVAPCNSLHRATLNLTIIRTPEWEKNQVLKP